MKRQTPQMLLMSVLISLLVIAGVSYYKAAKQTKTDVSGNGPTVIKV